MSEGQLGYQLKRAEHALATGMTLALRELGLTVPQFTVLIALTDQPGLSGARLARRCFVTPQSMNTTITTLEEAGLLMRRPHPEYRRVLCNYVTPKAEDLVQEAFRRVIEVEERMMAWMSEDQKQLFIDTLRQCADELEKKMAETRTK